MIKVALIGIGGMGKVHFDAYKTVDTAEVIAVADVRTEMAKEKVADDNIKIYATMDELLANEKPDMVDICTPSYTHPEIAVKALEAGVHVLCEKPMSVSSKDTVKVIEAAKKSGKLFMVAHVVRFMKPYLYLKNIIDSGELGKPVHIEMRRLSSIPSWSWQDWMRDLSKSGGTPMDLSIHDIDFAQYVFGQPEKVSAVYKKLENNNDHITSVLVYDGFTVTATSGWFNCDYPFKAEYEAIFENGYVSYVNDVVVKNDKSVDIKKEEASENTGINLSGTDGFPSEIQYFVDCVNNNKEPQVVTPKSSEDTVKLVERILENAIIL